MRSKDGLSAVKEAWVGMYPYEQLSLLDTSIFPVLWIAIARYANAEGGWMSSCHIVTKVEV